MVQLVQVVAPDAEYVPVGHELHWLDPEVELYIPAEHDEHEEAPAGEYVPAGHALLHSDEPAELKYPAKHIVHEVLPALEYVPEEQIEQEVLLKLFE